MVRVRRGTLRFLYWVLLLAYAFLWGGTLEAILVEYTGQRSQAWSPIALVGFGAAVVYPAHWLAKLSLLFLLAKGVLEFEPANTRDPWHEPPTRPE